MKKKIDQASNPLLTNKALNSFYFENELVDRNGKYVRVFKTGDNFKTKQIKRGYLTQDEANNFMMMASMQMAILGDRSLDYKQHPALWEEWSERKIITPEQQKNLKMATTYFGKFIKSVFDNNFDIASKEKFAAQLLQYDFRVVDDYSFQKIQRMLNDAVKEFHFDHDEFLDMIESVMENNCKGCNKDRTDCKWRKFFENRLIPPPIEVEGDCENRDNCEYSY